MGRNDIIIAAAIGAAFYFWSKSREHDTSFPAHTEQGMVVRQQGGVITPTNVPVSNEVYKAVSQPEKIVQSNTQQMLQQGLDPIVDVRVVKDPKTGKRHKSPVSYGGVSANISPIVEVKKSGAGYLVATPTTQTTLSKGVVDLMKRRGVI